MTGFVRHFVYEKDQVVVVQLVGQMTGFEIFQANRVFYSKAAPTFDYNHIIDMRSYIGAIPDYDTQSFVAWADEFKKQNKLSPDYANFVYLARPNDGSEFLAEILTKSIRVLVRVAYSEAEAWAAVVPGTTLPAEVRLFLAGKAGR